VRSVGGGGENKLSTFDTGCWDSCCYCMIIIGGVMGSGQSASVSDTGSSSHERMHACGGHTSCSKVYIDKQHTRSVRSLQLTHSETSTLWDHAWFSSSMKAPVSQAECIQFLNMLGGRCQPLCYTSPRRSICCYGAGGKRLNRQLLLTYRHSPPYWWTSAWWICLSADVIVRWWWLHDIVGTVCHTIS